MPITKEVIVLYTDDGMGNSIGEIVGAVVRCKDCKYWEYDVIFSDGWCRGKHQGNPSWFCADGERREDADNR